MTGAQAGRTRAKHDGLTLGASWWRLSGRDPNQVADELEAEIASGKFDLSPEEQVRVVRMQKTAEKGFAGVPAEVGGSGCACCSSGLAVMMSGGEGAADEGRLQRLEPQGHADPGRRH